jgi:uncharacterized protein with PhoU and TrkA domain
VQVVFLRASAKQEHGWHVPGADEKLGEGDVLILAGPKAAADRLGAL